MKNIVIGILIGFVSMYIVNQILTNCWISNDTKKFHNEIENSAKIDMKKFQKNIVGTQDRANKKLAKLCPNFVKTDNIYLAKIGGEA